MIDSPTDVARRLRRDARATRSATRYWAGWRLELTFGPYELSLEPEWVALAKTTAAAVYEQVHGKAAPAGPEADAVSLAAQRDLWHLSVSWRGGHPAEAARLLLADLVVAMGVPEDKRDGYQPARVFDPSGRPSPQVTHWTWKDPFKTCSCGKSYSADEWEQLRYVGIASDEVESLELRNCTCGSTISVVLPK